MGVLDSRSIKKISRRPVSEIHYSITPILRYSDLLTRHQHLDLSIPVVSVAALRDN
jgi:hypothetical protein